MPILNKPKTTTFPHPLDKVNVNIGPGWNKIIQQLAKQIQRCNSASGSISYIKEKWGILDIGHSCSDECTCTACREAIKASTHTCCMCASSKAALCAHRQTGWLSTLCSECAEANDFQEHEPRKN